jgi:hypothetical protein
MKNYLSIASICFLLITTSLFAQEFKPIAVFAGTSPCGNILKPFLGIANESECDFTKWTLTLNQTDNSTPSTFTLLYRFGVSKPSTPGFIDEKIQKFEGKWSITKGTQAYANAPVYELIVNNSNKTLSFVKMDDNLIHLLDSKKNLMIGNSGYSYTFNKMKP